MTGIGILGALLGGMLTLISPCSALLLPSFFAYAFDNLGKLVMRTLLFYAGLCLTLVPLGAAAGLFGALLAQRRGTVTLVSGVVLMGLGTLQITGRGFGVTAARRRVGRIPISSGVSVFALGSVYGLAGFCAGPLLGSVLTVSAAGGNPLYGAMLLAVFALGMAAPLFLLAALWERFDLGRRRWLRGRELALGRLRVHTTNLASGLLFIAIGALFVITDGTAGLGSPIGVDAQYTFGVWLRRTSGHVSNLTLLFAGALLALIVVLRWRHRLRREHTPSAGSRVDHHRVR
ncbi:cytochrome c biogenesis protein CcdA [Halopolyspora algeriensis]|uniref:Cytochrome c biogenesis protein CcdA n=1 Tax=Halopolyspora algeriensis TaxID=1500506 RepID=A0A368VUX7_9ACTN|nr:cytochrome c biogenesis CcdA family protein [Halopolyspora algeriensis]RCW44468.1 cytochrome c biogenesis protein CcdA [Halopolyspora algeriensis]TQM55829.1 cytochrome c biogenesis protein CcdA [Halopolyspora algeriensis]